jgi:Cytochrome P450
MVNIRSVLMDSSHWGDPETFRPERFIDDDGNFKKDEHLILFGTGIFSMLKICLHGFRKILYGYRNSHVFRRALCT